MFVFQLNIDRMFRPVCLTYKSAISSQENGVSHAPNYNRVYRLMRVKNADEYAMMRQLQSGFVILFTSVVLICKHLLV